MNEVKSFFWSKTFWLVFVVPMVLSVSDAIANGADLRQIMLGGFATLSLILRRVTKGGMDFSLSSGKGRTIDSYLNDDGDRITITNDNG